MTTAWTPPGLLAQRAAEKPDAEVVRFVDGSLTCGQLDERANRCANALRDLGLQRGDRVAVMLPNGPAFLTAWFGIARAGLVEVPINVAYRGDLLAYLLNQAGCRALVVDAPLLDRVAAVAGDLTTLERVFVVGPGGDAGGLPVADFDALVASGAATPPPEAITPDDTSGIFFTSGTTGPSKGVVRSHRADVTLAETTVRIMGYRQGDVLYTAFPLFHLNAKFNSVVPALLIDGTLVLHDRFSASTFWDTCRKEGVTAFNFMGALLTMLMKQPERDDDADNPVRCAYGAPAPATIFDAFQRRFGVRLVEVFGSTELGIATHNTIDDATVGSCGRAAPYYEVELHDEHDRPVPVGQEGEFVVRPKEPGVMFREYFGMPEVTLAAFRNLWFHTGDRGRQDAEGRFSFVDRMKDAIRRRGENISSWEVEKVLASHDAVAEVAVIGVPDEVSEEEVMAVVVRKEGADLTAEQLLDFCVPRLAHFAVPRYVRFVDELPKTPSQRIEKYRLREQGLTPDTWDRTVAGYEVRR